MKWLYSETYEVFTAADRYIIHSSLQHAVKKITALILILANLLCLSFTRSLIPRSQCQCGSGLYRVLGSDEQQYSETGQQWKLSTWSEY